MLSAAVMFRHSNFEIGLHVSKR